MVQSFLKVEAITVTELERAIAEVAHELHPDQVAILASRIQNMNWDHEDTNYIADQIKGIKLPKVSVLADAWACSPTLSPSELSATLRGASSAFKWQLERADVELVWSGPTTGLVPVRHTEQVLIEVIQSATKCLFLVSFVAYEISSVVKALNECTLNGVKLFVLLEPSSQSGGNVSTDSINTIRELVPGSKIYTWNPDRQKEGSIHAKCVVADEDVAFITSANLSEAAMERNMELGVLLKGGHAPMQLHKHLMALIETEIVRIVQ